MQFLQNSFGPLVLLFTVSNLGAMGLQVRMSDVFLSLKNKKSLMLIFVWGWVVGPALGYLITIVLPLAEPFVIVVLLTSLAPCAPFLQQMVVKSRGDMGFAGALIPLVALGTVLLMPLMAPLLIKGLTISAWALAKPLLLTILLPLMIGAVIRYYADNAATKIFPAIKLIALISTLATILWCLVLYGPAIRSFAICDRLRIEVWGIPTRCSGMYQTGSSLVSHSLRSNRERSTGFEKLRSVFFRFDCRKYSWK